MKFKHDNFYDDYNIYYELLNYDVLIHDNL
jgi:hypothetical protein